jgi:hypothetical protein
VLELPKDRFGAASLERPALVRVPGGSWRLYVSCALVPRPGAWVARGAPDRGASGDAPIAAVRYLDVLPLAGGGHRRFYERPRADGAHELCTERAP